MPTAPSKYLFTLRCHILCTSLLAAKAIESSKIIEAVISIVLALSIPEVLNSLQKSRNVSTAPIRVVMIINFRDQLKMCSCFGLGFLSIMPSSPCSVPRARVGRLSVTRFIHNICIGSIAMGIHRRILASTTKISSKFTANINLTHFLILS